MKKFLIYFILIFFIYSKSSGQESYEWDNIQKTELYFFSDVDYCKNIESSNLTPDIVIECNKNEFKNHLIQLREPEFDVLIEKECLILKVHFSNTISDFIVYRKQGIIMDLNKRKVLFQIDNKAKFDYLITKSLK